MNPGEPDVINQMPPAGGGVGRPTSGVYGEKTEMDRLMSSLPQSEPVGPPPPGQAPTPSASFGQAPMPKAPSALPAGMFAPTQRPDVPVSTPLAGPVDPFAGAADARQRRLRYLDILSTHSDASPEVREWAEVTKQKLISRG